MKQEKINRLEIFAKTISVFILLFVLPFYFGYEKSTSFPKS